MQNLQYQTGYRQELSQQQKLSLNAEMRQSLAVLRMPVGELCAYINEQLKENPVLEFDPTSKTEDDIFSNTALPDEALSDTPQQIWEERELFNNEFLGKGSTVSEDSSHRELDFYADTGESLIDALREQLPGIKLSQQLTELCEYLIECLDYRGYLPFPIEELASETGASVFDLTQALYAVQSLHPLGAAARSLEECLMIQLVQSSVFNQHTLKIVREGLPLLAENDLKALSHLLGCTAQETAKWANAVRGLNPIPAQGYAGGDRLAQIIPDAKIEREGEALRITINRGLLPRLELSAEYQSLMNNNADKVTAAYLKEKHTAAKILINSVNERENTLAKLLACVVEMQPAYFLSGAALLPITMNDIAGRMGLHISTISRAVQNKYIVCAAGTVAIKSLFTSAVKSSSGGEVSSAFAREKIRQCIEAEDKSSPFSDEDIRAALLGMDVSISRRTVAKYREELGIPSSSKRKRI